MENTIYICAHCNRADTQTRSWHQVCKLHMIETTEDCVILTKGKTGLKVKFYDPNPLIVQAEIDRIEEVKLQKALARGKKK